MLPMADDRSHNNDNDTTATPPAPNLPAVKRFFRLQNDLMAAHPLQVGSWGMRAWSIQPVELVPRCLRCSLTPLLPVFPRHSVRLHNIIFHIVRSLACHFLHYATVFPLLELVQVLARSLKASPIPSTIFKRCSIPRPTLSICALKFVFNFWLSTFLFFRSPALPPHCPHCPAPHFNFNCHSRA